MAVSSTITANKIAKNYAEGFETNHVLRNISVSFHRGNSYAIRGVSGSGKSTLLHILSGFEKPSSGEILFNGNNVFALKDHEKSKLLNEKLGFVFQFHYLVNEITVLENVMLVGQIAGLNRNASEKRALELLGHVGLSEYLKRYPYQLSGGEQQRVSIARALFNKPDFILADEPTGNLDAENAKNIVDLFMLCKQQWGVGLIVCSHDQHVCNSMKESYVLRDGELSKF